MLMKILSIILLFFLVLVRTAGAQVVAENFRNTDCGNCRVPDLEFEQFIEDYPNYKIILINYHNSNPYPQDPFYLASKADVDYRSNTYYVVMSDPWMFIQGINASSTVSTWKSYAQQAAGIPLPINYTVSAAREGNLITITAKLTGSSQGKEIRPFAMIMESGIEYNNTYSYKNPISGKWDHVFRAMAPKKDGGDPFILAGEKDLVLTYDASGKNWNFDNIYVVLILQETTVGTANSRPILGAAVSPMIPSSVNDDRSAVMPQMSVPYPNPVSGTAHIEFSSPKHSLVEISVSDALGNTTNVFTRTMHGSGVAEFDTQLMPKGMYIVRMTCDGVTVSTAKMVIDR